MLPNLRYTANVDESPEGAGVDQAANAGAADETDIPMRDGVPQRRASDRLLSGTATPADTQYQAGLYNAIRLLQGHLGHQAAPSAPAEPSAGVAPHQAGLGKPYSSEQLVGVLENLQAQALTQSQALISQNEGGLITAPQSIPPVSQQMLE